MCVTELVSYVHVYSFGSNSEQKMILFKWPFGIPNVHRMGWCTCVLAQEK